MSSVIYSAETTRTFADIGSVIEEFRRRRGLSQEELAEKAEVSSSHISRIEGGSKTPSVELLDKIFTVLNIQMRMEIKDNERL